MPVEIIVRSTLGSYTARAKGYKLTASRSEGARQAAEALLRKLDLGAGQLQEQPIADLPHGQHCFLFHIAEPKAVTWSSQKPAAPGAYWIRGNGLSRPALIEVVLEQEQLRCNLHDRTTCDDFGFGYSVEQLSEKFEFLGPLGTQVDPGEVGRWKATAEHFTGVSIKAAEEVARLRTQLAEQHGLLCSAYSDMEHAIKRLGQCVSCDGLSEDDGIITHDPACMFCAIEIATHATSEPNTPESCGVCADCLNGCRLEKESPPAARDEQADFEAYALNKGWLPHQLKKRPDGNYEDWGVNPEWQAWKARAALARVEAQS
ncbi:TPA: hypothetical protein L6B04_16015 [Pseudomonas aeruginosa]|nr:hypothetical protein [Pseudomonas aeruginosa]